MLGKLEFLLPEENEQFNDAQEGGSLRAALCDIDNWLRGIIKHGDEAAQKLDAQEVRDHIHEALNTYNLSIWR